MIASGKIKNIGFVAIALVLFTSCQKEVSDPDITGTNNNNNNTTDFKVRKYREAFTSASGSYSETFLVNYDANGRLLSLVDSADATTKQVYTYTTGTTYTMELFNAGVMTIHNDFFLNSIPLIDSNFQYNNTGDTTLEKVMYDASNRPVQIKDYDYTTAGGAQIFEITDYTYDANDNVTQETENMSGTTYSYEFYSDLNTIDVGTPYEFKNKNLTKKTIINDGSSTVTILHNYTFDNLNRITSETQAYDTGETDVKTYTYN